MNAQGEDVVAGIRTPQPISELEEVMPEAYKQLREITEQPGKALPRCAGLRIHHRRRQAVHAANAQRQAHRSGRRAHCCGHGGRRPDHEERSRPARRAGATRPVAASCARSRGRKTLQKIATGLPASPGAAVGRAAFSSEDAVELAAGGPVILVRKETTPDDIHGMDVSKGILTAVGGLTSHAAVVARGMGRPCVVGASTISVSEGTKSATINNAGKKLVVKEGDWISLDGTHGEVYLGQCKTSEPDPKSHYFATFMQWADEFRGRFGVRANADIPRDAKQARLFGAEGIGLCRTEHMFFAEDRITHMQAMILARDEKTRRNALEKASADAAQRLRRTVRGHGRLPGRNPHSGSAAARVPAEAREPDGGHRAAARRRNQSQEGNGRHLRRGSAGTQNPLA